MTRYLPDELICPQCLTLQAEPFAEGDQCVCGGHFVGADILRQWRDVFALVGAVVAHARIHRDTAKELLAVQGAIGRILIDRPEFDGHEQRARQSILTNEQKRSHT